MASLGPLVQSRLPARLVVVTWLERDLVASLADFYNGHPDARCFPMLSEVGNLLVKALEADDVRATKPLALPVVRLLAGIETRSEVSGVGAVLTALVAAAPALRWIQTPAYKKALSPRLIGNYGYVRVMGPGGLVESSVASAGLGVWGAGLTYPKHEHPAEETYHLLHGSALFQRGRGQWEPKRTGESVHHEPWEPHAQRFGDETCVLLWAWTGEVSVNARLLND